MPKFPPNAVRHSQAPCGRAHVCAGPNHLWRRRTRAAGGFLTLGLSLSCHWATAQDALFSALEVDRTTTPRTGQPLQLPPDQPHLGPVQFQVSAHCGVGIDDNINLSQINRQSDTILFAGLYAYFFWPVTEQSVLDFNTGFGYSDYLSHGTYNRFNVAPGSALNWTIGFDDGALTFFDNFSYTDSVLTQAALSGIAQLPIFDNTVGARASWLPGQWQFQTGYSHDNYFSDAASYQYLNRASEYFFARSGWRFAEKTQAGLEASASITDYELASQGNSISYSVGPYADWQVTKFLNASVRGGPTFYEFNRPGNTGSGSSLNSYYLGLDIQHQLTDFISQSLSVQRSVQLGLNQGSQYIEQTTATYAASWALTRSVRVAGNFYYQLGTQPLAQLQPGVSVLENYSRFGVGPTLSWQMTGKLSGSLGFLHWVRHSNIAENNYSEDNFTLGFDYRF